MNKHKSLLRLSASAALLAAIAFPQVAGATGITVHPAAALALADKTAALQTEWSSFVTQQYGVKLSGAVTREQFTQALAKIVASASSISEKEALAKGFLPESKAGSTKLAAWEAISAAVQAADLKELAYTYSEEKVEAAWKKAGLPYKKGGNISLQAAQQVAVAIDTELVSTTTLASIKAEGDANAQLVYQLLGKVLEFHGKYKNYLGTIADEDIYGKLVHAWNESQIIKAGELQELVDKGLKQNLITGYNLKDTTYDPHFDPERTITYGHSDIAHAIQLIGLLKSEGIQANIQFEPKTSAFIYLKEWGEPVQTPDYEVVQIDNGNFIAYAKEYDLSFEFATVDDKKKFQPIIFKYAKKDKEDMTGLLKASWWQPLYHSRTPLADYQIITNNVLKQGRFLVQSFSLNDQSAKVVDGFKKIDPKINVETYQFWVDQPFYNYLLGEYK